MRSAGRGHAAALVVVALGVLGVVPASADGAAPDPACTAPTIQDLGPFVPIDDDLPGEVFGVEIPVPSPSAFPDTDGDGTADTVTHDADARTLTVVRGDGTATVTELPPSLDPDTISHGDLDGDGRDELWAEFRMPGMFGTDQTLVITGALPTGSSDTPAVALSVRGFIIGDVSGDELDDIQVVVDGDQGPELIGHHSFVGALSLAGGGPAFPATAPLYGIGGDVDQDGEHDRVTIGRDGAPGTLHLSATGTTLAFTPPVAYGAVAFSRLDGATYLVTDRRIPGPKQHHRYRIRLDCNAPWVRHAGQEILGRPGTPADLVGLSPSATSTVAGRRPTVTAMVRSAEGRGHLVDQRFQQALGRATDPVGRAWWVRALREGRRNAQDLSATLFGSNEFYRASGGTLDGWVSALYQRSLGYAPDPAGRAFWKARATALGRERAAVRFLNAAGARRSLVRSWYLSGPGRPATEAEVAAGELAFAADGWDGFLVWVTTTDDHYRRSQGS